MASGAVALAFTYFHDVVHVSLFGFLHLIVRLFTGIAGEPQLGAVCPWICLPQVSEITGLPARRVKRLLKKASLTGVYASRSASGQELQFLREAGIIPPAAREATLVTFKHAILALRKTVDPAIIEQMELLARQRIGKSLTADGVRLQTTRCRVRVQPMPTADAPRPLHDAVLESGRYGLTAADLAKWPMIDVELDALVKYYSTRINAARVGKASSYITARNTAQAARAFLGWMKHAYPRGGRAPSLTDYTNGAYFRAYLDYLAARAERSHRATMSEPGTHSQVRRPRVEIFFCSQWP